MPRKDLSSYPKKMGYRKHSGMVAWLLHRITAVIIVLYFFMHMLSSSGVCSFLGTIVNNKIAIAVMIVSFVFHGLNGVRIMMMEFCKSAEKAHFNKVLYSVEILVVVISAAGVARLFMQ